MVEFVYGPLAESPYLVGKPLRGDLEGHYGARRGQYRILYRVIEDEVVVIVIDIAHRADVYRPR